MNLKFIKKVSFTSLFLIVPIVGYAQSCDLSLGACVRDMDDSPFWETIPKDKYIDWGWEVVEFNEDVLVEGEVKNICPKTVGQALLWLSNSAIEKDEASVNKAMGVYDWGKIKSSDYDSLFEVILDWPEGVWEQQVGIDQDEEVLKTNRYRYITDGNEVVTWVRVNLTNGCYLLSNSPPKKVNTRQDIN